MTAALQRKATLRTRAAPQQRRRKASPVRLHLASRLPDADGAGTDKPTAAIPLDRLRAAAARENAKPVPHRDGLIRAFGSAADSLEAVWSPEISTLLDLMGAQAAAVDGRVVLKGPDASFDTVAHETAHVLQARNNGTGELMPTGAAAEAEAEAAAEVADSGGRVGDLVQALPADAVALRLPAESMERAAAGRAARREFDAAARAPAADREISAERTPDDDAVGVEAADAAVAEGERVAAGSGDALEPAPTFETPPQPVIEVDGDALARADASSGEIAAATTPASYLDAIAAAPPSVKAQVEPRMEDDLARLAEGEENTFQTSVPDFEARMGGGEAIPPPVPVAPPGVTPEPLEANAPPTAAPADEGRLPAPEPYAANNRIVELLTGIFGVGDSASVGNSLSQVQTSDTVTTDPGPAPPVPLEGETDPRRVADQADGAGRQARNRRDEATDAVMNGRGPESVQARPLQETMPVPQLAQARFEGTAAAAEGAAAFRERSLDPEVVALFDAQHGPVMEASLSGARAELNAATASRDSDRQTEIAAAEAENARLNEAADQGQNRQIIASRNDIQAARQTAVDDQARAVGDLETAAGTEQQLAQGRINNHVTAENQRISNRYDTARRDAESDLREGERQATAKKAEARRDAENRSWWDRAVDWVADQFDRLTRAINRVFDAVRARIKDLVDAAKKFAEDVIDAAADFVKGAIRSFGEFMKSAVDTLLGDTFPGIARALNEGIDAAVETAVAAVDAIADGLKAGINALLDALGKALDAILAVFQAAVNAVLAIARAAITGDWSAVARMILEPILRALGIEPQEFYAFFGRVADVIGKIIDEPGVFLQNLLDGVMGGFRRFGDNLLRHLQAGIIGWLTGALGGDIILPERWDLMGVLDLIRQILGLTLAMIRRVAVRILGEAAVEKIEFFIAFAVELISGGWRAFFDRIKDSLGNLKTMVLDQVKNFLVERIVMAAVSWLIGLFNPVGALIKIVMTIWNLILFLKDQLMRIIEVVRTVVGLIIDIANRVLEPVITGVEGVLARMLPIVIDLLARLLGLGNVAGRVREIIGSVRQAIEDAIVGLIRRVVARFTGGRRDGAAGTEGAGDDASGGRGRIMAPITIRGGGQRHTLFIRTAADDATPMLRSDEQPVAVWLDSLKTPDTVKALLQKNNPEASEETIRAVYDDLQPLVRDALGEEAQLENEADEAVRAPAAATAAGDVTPAGPDADTTREGRQLAAVIRLILERLGLIDETGLAEKFETDIGNMRPAVGENFSRFILPKMESSANAYGRLDWTGVRRVLPGDSSSLTGPWQRPAAGAGVLRKRTAGAFSRAAIDKARDVAHDLAEAGMVEAEHFNIKNKDSETFISTYLASRLNQSDHARKLIGRLLGPRQTSWTVILNDVTRAFDDAVRAALGKRATRHPDVEIGKQITGTTYRELYQRPGQLLTKTYPYYREQTEDGKKKEGSAVEHHTLDWFLNPRQPHSDRHGENRTRVAKAVRAASPGQHEWILSSTAYAAINATIAAVRDRGAAGGLEGIANFLQFQHEVRTSTSDLIFDPKWAGTSSTVGFFSPGHYQRIISGTPADPDAEYEGLPAQGAPVKTLQAHAGGLSAFQPEGAGVGRYPLQQVSPRWHRELKQEISMELADDGHLELKSIEDLGNAVTGYFRTTVLGSPDNIGNLSLLGAGEQAFNLYYVTHGSDGRPKDLAAMTIIAREAYERADDELETRINKVLGG
jgi:hypothetical protein